MYYVITYNNNLVFNRTPCLIAHLIVKQSLAKTFVNSFVTSHETCHFHTKP